VHESAGLIRNRKYKRSSLTTQTTEIEEIIKMPVKREKKSTKPKGEQSDDVKLKIGSRT